MIKKILILIFISNNLFGQTVGINLRNVFEGEKLSRYVIAVNERVNDKSSFKGINIEKYQTYELFIVSFNSGQSCAEEVNKGKHKKAVFIDHAIKNDIDTNYILYKDIERNKFAILVAFDNDGLKHIIVDANNNNDFGDDEEYVFDLIKERKFPQVLVEIEYFDGLKINKTGVPYTIDAYNIYQGNNSKELSCTLWLVYEKIGKSVIDSKLYNFRIRNPHLNLYKNEKFLINITQNPLDSTDNNDYWYDSKHPVVVGNYLYKVDSLVNDFIYLTYKHKIENGQGKVNTYAVDFSGRDLITEQLISLKRSKGNYVLVDFWGSWCKPCIEALPEIKSLDEKYRKKGLKLISIAYDKIKDKEKLKDLIKNEGLFWNHLFIENNARNPLIISYKINKFPTTLLVDPTGKIVVRVEGAKGMHKIDEYLEQIFRVRKGQDN